MESIEPFIPWLNSRENASSSPQFHYWSEKLLSKSATIAGEGASEYGPSGDNRYVPTALKLFRLWAALPQVNKGTVSHPTQLEGSTGAASSASTWKSYYDVLTLVLQNQFSGPAKSGEDRPQFAGEFQRVQAMSEKGLLHEEKFPVANSHSHLIENWVEQVVGNWEVLCGPQWSDADIGDGGQNGVGRRVLDVSILGKKKRKKKKKKFLHSLTGSVDFIPCRLKNVPLP